MSQLSFFTSATYVVLTTRKQNQKKVSREMKQLFTIYNCQSLYLAVICVVPTTKQEE
jgi:hypothetical protein